MVGFGKTLRPVILQLGKTLVFFNSVMEKIVECVPNFSEGKDRKIISTIVAEVEGVVGVKLLGVESDPDHNRTVVTFLGSPQDCARAAFVVARRAVELIDMNRHRGEHPRIGAIDVVPFVPLLGMTMVECVQLAVGVGRRIAEELKLPVFLYEEAARIPTHRNLADIRRGEYEALKVEIGASPLRTPDFGPRQLHPTAGACVVGARKPLIAFNVYLATRDSRIAREIAGRVRERDGGFPAVKALGMEIKEQGCVQVSLNLCDFEKTNMDEVFLRIKSLARRHGVGVIKSEIYGLLPLAALAKMAKDVLKAPDFKVEQILETHLWE